MNVMQQKSIGKKQKSKTMKLENIINRKTFMKGNQSSIIFREKKKLNTNNTQQRLSKTLEQNQPSKCFFTETVQNSLQSQNRKKLDQTFKQTFLQCQKIKTTNQIFGEQKSYGRFMYYQNKYSLSKEEKYISKLIKVQLQKEDVFKTLQEQTPKFENFLIKNALNASQIGPLRVHTKLNASPFSQFNNRNYYQKYLNRKRNIITKKCKTQHNKPLSQMFQS